MSGPHRRGLDGHAPAEPTQEDGRNGTGSAAGTRLSPRPVLLLADSQCLFGEDARDWLRPLAGDARGGRAVYLGASNGDDPAACAIFDQAASAAGYDERSAISGSAGDAERFEGADLVVLAGGDPLLGWRVFEANGWVEPLRRSWAHGALLVGVSAGAVQLGLGFRAADGSRLAMLALAPFWVGAHEEANDWTGLKATLEGDPENRSALAVPFGAAARVSPGGQVEALRKPVAEVEWRNDRAEFRWHPPNRLPMINGTRTTTETTLDDSNIEEIDHG